MHYNERLLKEMVLKVDPGFREVESGGPWLFLMFLFCYNGGNHSITYYNIITFFLHLGPSTKVNNSKKYFTSKTYNFQCLS